MKRLFLKYGKGKLGVNLPDSMCYNILYPSKMPVINNPLKAVKKALEAPIGTFPLKQLVKYKNPKEVVILASDITRPAPSRIMISPIIEELTQSGITYDKITIIFALGAHRKMKKSEMREILGEEICNKVKCINHDINDCIYVGTTARGTSVEVFRPVVQSDFVIATGNLELHWFAGYSGGYKAIVPGVCSKKTIEANHSMLFAEGAEFGKIDGNPVREDIEEGGKLVGVDFLVNAVLDGDKNIVEIVAGDPIKAHRAGTHSIDKMYKKKIHKKYDLVIASSGGYPKDINLYQAHKGLENASHALKPGGSIILVSECRDGIGDITFENWMKEAKTPQEPIERLHERFLLGGHKAAAVCRIILKHKVYLISTLNKMEVREMFIIPVTSVSEAIEKIFLEKGKRNIKVLIIPYANSTFPYFSKE